MNKRQTNDDAPRTTWEVRTFGEVLGAQLRECYTSPQITDIQAELDERLRHHTGREPQVSFNRFADSPHFEVLIGGTGFQLSLSSFDGQWHTMRSVVEGFAEDVSRTMNLSTETEQ